MRYHGILPSWAGIGVHNRDETLAIELLERQAAKLVAEQRTLRRKLFDILGRDKEIDKLLSDCISGARAFGHALHVQDAPTVGVPGLDPSFDAQLPAGLKAIPQELRRYVYYRLKLHELRGALVTDDRDAALPPPPPPPPELPLAISPMPKVADVVLDRLKAAGKQGAKASAIQGFIEHTYGAKIHEKTVGMTLYRLQKAGQVTRDKHIWFLASSEAKNPGAGTPGPNNPAT